MTRGTSPTSVVVGGTGPTTFPKPYNQLNEPLETQLSQLSLGDRRPRMNGALA